jgi:beta-galactosidase
MYKYVDVADVHYDLPTIDKIALHAAYPDKAMTQSESWSTTLYADRQLAVDHSWFVGSWVWTGFDYMGESGIGSPIYGKSETGLGPFGMGVYPWFQSGCGDIDFIGVRKPQNYRRAVAFGDSPIEMMVQRPAPAGTTQFNYYWSYYMAHAASG